MNCDVFGDLQDWGRVLDRIGKLREDGTLDDHQSGLARVARYPSNWQLRKAALRAIAELKRPGDEIARVAVQILLDDDGDLETRILAGNALRGALNNSGGATISGCARSEVAQSIRTLLEKPQPPMLRTSARRWEESLRPVITATATGTRSQCQEEATARQAAASIFRDDRRRVQGARMAKLGVRLLNKYGRVIRCEACELTWYPQSAADGSLPRGFWRCPNRCNW